MDKFAKTSFIPDERGKIYSWTPNTTKNEIAKNYMNNNCRTPT